MTATRDLFSYRPYWAERFGVAPELPTTREELNALGWDSCDVIIVTGDAYVDHPSFGMAIIGRLLEAQGFRVGIIAQPDWKSADDVARLGRPNLFFGVTGGNMDSMVNRYTADRRIRSDDAYSPDGAPDRRPDRAVLVYAQRCREAFSDVPLIIGGIEASLRRVAHYDVWSDKVRRSVLVDAKADLLVYGNAERAIVEIAHRLAGGEAIGELEGIRGTALMRRELPPSFEVLDGSSARGREPPARTSGDRDRTVVRLPSYEAVAQDKLLYAHASRIVHRETNPGNARALVQRHGDRELWVNPPPIPLTTQELDRVYELPYTRRPYSGYGEVRIPAYEMIRFSVNIMRGCFGGCTFCSITEHEGRIIQSRSEGSILREIERIRDTVPGFTGFISDLGGPTANMYRLACKDKQIEQVCRRPSCVYPDICPNLDTNHDALIRLYRKARALPGVKTIVVASGLRYDLAVRSPEYVRELTQHHVGGYLKIAPEHTERGPLEHMMKPGIGTYDRFKELFDRYSAEAGKEQYLIPYFIAAHPGTRDEDMLQLALWLKRNGYRADQVQTFLPTPMATATAMYHSGKNPLRKVTAESPEVVVARGMRQRRLHKAFLRYHDPQNWRQLYEALVHLGRKDLLGPGPRHLIPRQQPGHRGKPPRGRRHGVFTTQHLGLPRTPSTKRRRKAKTDRRRKGR